jgi:hypothetical protein
MSTKSHTHKMHGTLRKTSFCTKGYAEIHIQRLVFDIEKGIWKILGQFENPNSVHMIWCPLYT